MSLQEIKIGNFANDGTGDDLREAFRKVNLNFQELDLRDDESTTASNIGEVGEGVFGRKLGYELQFKRLVAGKDILLSSNDDRILVEANGGVKSLLVISDNGSVFLDEVASLTVSGINDIETSIVDDNNLQISYTGNTDLVSDPNPKLGADLDAQGFSLTSVGTIDAANISGNFTGNVFDQSQDLIFDPVTGVLNLSKNKLNSLLDVDDKPALPGDVLKWDGNKWSPAPVSTDPFDFDFGEIIPNVTSITEWIATQTEVDFGTITNPSPFVVDLGTI